MRPRTKREAEIRARKAFDDAIRFGDAYPLPAPSPAESAAPLQLAGLKIVTTEAARQAREHARLLRGPCVRRKLSISDIERLIESGIPCQLLPSGLIKVPRCYVEEIA